MLREKEKIEGNLWEPREDSEMETEARGLTLLTRARLANIPQKHLDPSGDLNPESPSLFQNAYARHTQCLLPAVVNIMLPEMSICSASLLQEKS